MKKILVVALGASLLFSSCVSTSQGAYTGGSFGTILGSAIGGLLGGPHGSDIGTIVGMAGGAAMGAAVGHSNEKREVREHYQRVQDNKAQGYNPYATDSDMSYGSSLVDDTQSGFDPNGGGDDRIVFDTTSVAQTPVIDDVPNIEIRRVVFEDATHDGTLGRGELGKVVFEVVNRSSYPIDNIEPTVIETTGNRYVTVSPAVRVERIMPGAGIRYTATVKASGRVKAGSVRFVPMVVQGGTPLAEGSPLTVPVRR